MCFRALEIPFEFGRVVEPGELAHRLAPGGIAQQGGAVHRVPAMHARQAHVRHRIIVLPETVQYLQRRAPVVAHQHHVAPGLQRRLGARDESARHGGALHAQVIAEDHPLEPQASAQHLLQPEGRKAGRLGIDPPGFVAEVVAFAFGLAASSFFPVILMGIFSRRMNREGAIAGMVAGILFTATYIVWFKFVHPEANVAANWWFGISPEGIGALGMVVNFAVAIVVARFTPAPPVEVQQMIDRIRIPRGAGEAHEINA